jgi:5'-nucleotidase
MKFLLTNDDGMEAPGLESLLQAAARIGEPVLVAPAGPLSGCSHQVTTGRPIRVVQLQPNRFVVHGTPADCVRVALHDILPDPDWVLSGINAGGNLGADVHHSGTVAAVREGVLHGRPGIALSHYRKKNLSLDWQRASAWADRLLRELLDRPRTPGTFWNVNLPHLDAASPEPQIVFCPLDLGPLPLSYRRDGEMLHYDGDYHRRQRQPGADVDVCFRGHIAVSALSLSAGS